MINRTCCASYMYLQDTLVAGWPFRCLSNNNNTATITTTQLHSNNNTATMFLE